MLHIFRRQLNDNLWLSGTYRSLSRTVVHLKKIWFTKLSLQTHQKIFLIIFLIVTTSMQSCDTFILSSGIFAVVRMDRFEAVIGKRATSLMVRGYGAVPAVSGVWFLNLLVFLFQRLVNAYIPTYLGSVCTRIGGHLLRQGFHKMAVGGVADRTKDGGTTKTRSQMTYRRLIKKESCSTINEKFMTRYFRVGCVAVVNTVGVSWAIPGSIEHYQKAQR